MNSTARISLLFGALILLVFGIVCLKQQLGPGSSPPAFVPPSTEQSAADPRVFSGHQPTILSAEPIGEHDVSASPRLREVSPVPVDGQNSTPLDFPVNSTRPDFPREVLPIPSDGAGTAPSPREFPGADGSAALPTPVENGTLTAATRIPAVAPTTVITVVGDSLWTISERVYGSGDFYKALFLHNRELLPRPDRIAAGIQLRAPSLEELRQRFPDACPPTADPPAPSSGS